MAQVQLHHDSDVIDTLRRDDVEAFGYRVNRLGFSVILVLGGIMLAAAGSIYTTQGLTQPLWTAILGGLVGGGLYLAVNLARWYAFQRTHFVAISSRRLYVGRETRMWSIDWRVLDPDALGLNSMDTSTISGSMTLDVGGQSIDLELYNAYCYLEDIQGFMLEVLTQLKQHREE